MTQSKCGNNSDMCNNIPACNFTGKWLECTILDYRVFIQASNWLRGERNFKAIPIDGVSVDGKPQFTFKFVCEAEYMLFVLRWG